MNRRELRAVGHRYGDGPWLFRDVSWVFEPGSLTAITGPSGSGKTTLLAILGGLLSPHEGESPGADEPSAWVFQAASGIPRRTAVDHVAYPLLVLGTRRDEAEGHALRLLRLVGLEARAHDEHRTLSGGEAQRVALARAIATQRSVILADEPTAQLDRATAAVVADALEGLTDGNRTVVVATHDPFVVARCSRQLDLGAR